MKKFLLIIFTLGLLIAPISSFAQTPTDFEIIPKASSGGGVVNAVNAVGQTGGGVRDAYNAQAIGMKNKVGDQIASGIMTRDTLLDYIVYLVRFLSQIGIFIGVVMIIYAGYLYASSIFSPSNMSKGKAAITNAIIGVLIISFSYAIMKLLTSAFLS
ncbi:MAG: hypothetical protein NT085_05215 [candidate division SR1 bacterium]|nr:hypothetical protein [candidate division SR1 bacterium]